MLIKVGFLKCVIDVFGVMVDVEKVMCVVVCVYKKMGVLIMIYLYLVSSIGLK